MEPTGRAFVDFWSWAAEKGLMNANTAGSLRAATKEVLSAVDGDNWESADVSKIDVEDYQKRFENLRAAKFKPSSLNVYKSRFRGALTMYLDYLANPAGWRYKAERPAAARKRTASNDTSASITRSAISSGLGSPTAGVITYPYPLRDGLIVHLQLPPDLSKPEAKRLAAFLDSLAIEEQRALPPARLDAVPDAS